MSDRPQDVLEEHSKRLPATDGSAESTHLPGIGYFGVRGPKHCQFSVTRNNEESHESSDGIYRQKRGTQKDAGAGCWMFPLASNDCKNQEDLLESFSEVCTKKPSSVEHSHLSEVCQQRDALDRLPQPHLVCQDSINSLWQENTFINNERQQ